jgi:hypothetical protein
VTGHEEKATLLMSSRILTYGEVITRCLKMRCMRQIKQMPNCGAWMVLRGCFLRCVGTIKFEIVQMINLLPMSLLQFHMLTYEFIKFH